MRKILPHAGSAIAGFLAATLVGTSLGLVHPDVILYPGDSITIRAEAAPSASVAPSEAPSTAPSLEPTLAPTPEPTLAPTPEPTPEPFVAQVARPVADIETGQWTTPPLWDLLNDDVGTGDATAASSDNDAADSFTVQMDSLNDPTLSAPLGDLVVNWTSRKGASGGMAIYETITVLQGTTVIATYGPTEVLNTTFEQRSFRLTDTQRDAIQVWAGLYVKVDRTHVGTDNRNLRIGDIELEVVPDDGATSTPTPTPTPSPTPVTSLNVSGMPLPPVPAGYTRVAGTEFPNTTALGQLLHADTAQYLDPRPSGPGDCQYLDSSQRGRYCGYRTLREANGVLGHYLHTEQQADCANPTGPVQHVGTGNCNYVSGLLWTIPNQDEFIVTFTAKYDVIPGRKAAHLRWCGPRVGDPGYCEDNLPEFKMEAGPRGYAFHHHESRSTQDSQPLNLDMTQWHQFRMEVKPCQYVDFKVDGVSVMKATSYVTCNPSYWVGQMETYLAGQTIPEPDNAGWAYWDNFAVDIPSN